MSKGYFICKGDKTSCGGEVLDGDSRITMFGFAHARAGDRVCCGKSNEIFQILGVSPTLTVMAGPWPARWTVSAVVPAKPR